MLRFILKVDVILKVDFRNIQSNKMKHCLFCKNGNASFMCCYALFCASFSKAESTLVLIFILFACLNVLAHC